TTETTTTTTETTTPLTTTPATTTPASTTPISTSTTSKATTTNPTTTRVTTTLPPTITSTECTTEETEETTPTPPINCDPQCDWSEWFDVSYPKNEPNGGDFETYENIVKAGLKVCEGDVTPENISCRAEKYPDVPLNQLGQMVTCDVSTGLICNNKDLIGFMPVCYNYEISVYCCRPLPPECYSTTSQTTTSSTTTTVSPTTTTSETPTTSISTTLTYPTTTT
ncbi:hypothetical protein GDO81_026667, partial [Engystomops pustulosus]